MTASQARTIDRAIDLRGETVTISTYVQHPTGSYVDSTWGTADADHADYPGTAPADSYTEAQATGVVFPTRGKDAERLWPTHWGEHVKASRKLYLKGSQAFATRDKVTINSRSYWVLGFEPWTLGNVDMYTLAYLVEEVT